MRLGVFAGSFNPVHIGHEKIANLLLKDNIIDKIIIIPTNEKYHLKNNLLTFENRYNMLKIAFENKNIIISEIEKEKYHYTFENIKILKELYKNDELYLIIGADNLFELKEWKNYEFLLDNCKFIVFSRNNLNVSGYINKHFTNYANKFIIKEQIDNISSTFIRERIKNKLSVNEYLNKCVLTYIKENNLYSKE